MILSLIKGAYRKCPMPLRRRISGFQKGCARLMARLVASAGFKPIRVGNIPPDLSCKQPAPQPQPSAAAMEFAEASTHIGDFPVDWFEPRDLLTPWRFDFAAKHIYARLRENGVDSDWGRFVYAFHLSIWNGFFEDAPRKVSEADFLEAFHRIIDATRQATGRGLRSPVPLVRNGAPLDGAHRIVAALLLDKSVACIKTDVNLDLVDYDHRFFESRAALAGFAQASDIFDAMALEFCRLLPNIAIAVKFPAAKGRDDEVDRILSEHAAIFYRKAVTFENDGPVHLMRVLYEDEPWLGTYETDFDGARRKAGSCFHRRRPVQFFLLAYADQGELVQAKARVEGLFGRSNQSMHITNTRGEALRVAKLAFSNSSIRFVNARSLQEMPAFYQLLSAYRNALACVEDTDDFCIDGSAVMAAYGIRDCAEIEYISHGDRQLNAGSDALIGYHKEYGEHYPGKTLDDIVFHHCNHFYLNGMKFVSLGNVREWKRARDEPEDQVDVAFIDAWAARHPASVIDASARLTTPHIGSSLSSARKRMIRSMKTSTLNSVRRKIIKWIKGAPPTRR